MISILEYNPECNLIQKKDNKLDNLGFKKMNKHQKKIIKIQI